jgi:hypothetical protein
MTKEIRIIGDPPLAKDQEGRLRSRIGTVFPHSATIITLPGIHATQRLAYIDLLQNERAASGQVPLTRCEEEIEWNRAVDLVMEDDAILIRPDPQKMQLAFQADELLQECEPKHKLKFLYLLDPRVRDAIKQRGECWRVNPLPQSTDEIKRLVKASRIGISGKEIYYYNRITGTRYLTYQDFAGLGTLDDDELRQYLREIQEHAAKLNPQKNPEVAFFLAEGAFSAADFAPYDFSTLATEGLHAAFVELERKFRAAVGAAFRTADIENAEWRNCLYAELIGQKDQALTEEMLMGLSPEFHMQIEWLPGGRMEEGEWIMDPVLEGDGHGDPVLERLHDAKTQEFVLNFVREHGDLEYVNLGRVVGSLSRRRAGAGRRGVYIAQIKQRGRDREIISILRMQKYGVREHLDDYKPLLDAILLSEEYTEYILDRRLGCRQLGMNLPSRVTARRITERYFGKQTNMHGTWIWSPYFERDYIRGMATDKIPGYRFESGPFAFEFARLLGRAAAPNMIVGRCDVNFNVLFDDGDEVLVQTEDHHRTEIVVADQTGTFGDYRRDLQSFAADYALPIRKRLPLVSNPDEFARLYLDAFAERFTAIQQEYQRRKRGFDNLFQRRHRDEGGSFAYRWEKVLDRLSRADVAELRAMIAEQLKRA